MSSDPARLPVEELASQIGKFFGEQVVRITAPGGRSRGSFRVQLQSRSIIATYRDTRAETAYEARILAALSAHCDDVPQFLGLEEGLLFQSDVGRVRLGQMISITAEPARRQQLADAAVAAIFRYQRAAIATDLRPTLRHLGATRDWVENAISGADVLARLSGTPAPVLDRDAAIAVMSVPPLQFLKWDCRAGNAALDDAGKLRWFDFEFAGMRHGAEDLAWLIADEVWPVSVDLMFGIVRDRYDRTQGQAIDEYLAYLSVFATFHALQRVLLIIQQVRKRGWRSRARILARDDVGLHPEIGQNICTIAADLADMQALTRPLMPLIDSVRAQFKAAMPENDRNGAGGQQLCQMRFGPGFSDTLRKG